MAFDFVSTVLSARSAATSLLGSVASPLTNPITFGNATVQNTTALKPEYTLQIVCSDLGIYFKAPLPPEFDWATSAEYDTPLKEVIGDAVGSLGLIGKGLGALSRAQGVQLVTQALTAKFWSGSATSAITIPCILQAYSDEVEDVLKPLISMKALTMPRLQGGRRGSVLQAPGPHFDLSRAFQQTGLGSQSTDSKSVAGKETTGGSTSGLFGKLESAVKDIAKGYANGGLTGAGKEVANKAYGALEAADDFIRDSTRNVVTLQIGNYIRLPSVVITDVQQRHLVQPVGLGEGESTGNMQRVELSISFEPFVDLTFDDMKDVFLDPRVRAYVEEILAASNRS